MASYTSPLINKILTNRVVATPKKAVKPETDPMVIEESLSGLYLPYEIFFILLN
jgi:hypothetical protein